MCGVVGSVHVAAAQALHVVLRAKYGGYDHLVRIQPLRRERVKEVAPDAVQQTRGTRDQVGDGMCQRIYFVKVVGLYVLQLLLHALRFRARGDRGDADGLGDVQMFFVQVAERAFVADYPFDVSRFVQFEGHIFLLAAGKTRSGHEYGKNQEWNFVVNLLHDAMKIYLVDAQS